MAQGIPQPQSRTAEIRYLAETDPQKAVLKLEGLLGQLFQLRAKNITINNDQYSLNSLNGFFAADHENFFFKFHQEEGEETMRGEYYRADILAKAGLPVDQPVFVSSLPGEQILIYKKRNDPRFFYVLRAIEFDGNSDSMEMALQAERDLSASLLQNYSRTLHPISPDEAEAEPIHRLFHERMIDPVSRKAPGGRYADYYIGKTFEFPGLTLEWQEFSKLPFVINGRRYAKCIGELFNEAAERLAPRRLSGSGGVVAHGDAHNANVWYETKNGKPKLSFFDPAFAGSNVPTLLAEIKSTFHNIFAHPLWLYEPAEAAKRFHATAKRTGNCLEVETDWSLSAIRSGLLEVKATRLWRPLLAELSRRNMLPADWQTVIRLGLFLCPTLVMNLTAGAKTHNPVSSLIAFSIAVMVGSPPANGSDIVTAFFDQIDPAILPA